MSATEFLRKICELARAQKRVVIAVDFAPSAEGIGLTFRYRHS